jgi:hypothetical protein
VFLYLLCTPAQRRLILSPGTILMAAVFALCATPILSWNVIHHWPNARALASRSSLDVGFHLHPLRTLTFLGEQAVVISPLLYLGLLSAVVGLFLYRRNEDRIRFLLCDFFPIYACFTFFSLNAVGQPNWTAPALISGIILTVVFWKDVLTRSRGWLVPASLAVMLALAETVVLHDTTWLHLNPRKDPLQRAKGWEDLADHTRKWQTQEGADFIIGNHYSVASILSFYLPHHPATYTPTASTIDNQYDLWPGYHVGPDTAAIFVTYEEKPDAVPTVLRQEFKHITLLEKFWTTQDGRPVRSFQIYLCNNRE